MRNVPARILFVSGKGGTGKSFVAEALAERAAARGLEVALVRVRAAAGSADPDSGGSEHRTEAARPATAHASDGVTAQPATFHTTTLDERATLEKFLTRVLRLNFVARRLLDSRTFSAVAAAAPGLRDLVTLTAITALASPRRRRSFELIVVDAPASGHSVPLLTAPAQVLEIAPVGPVAREARAARELVADTQLFVPLIVTTPEELAINEALTLCEDLRCAGVAAPRVVVNGLWPGHLAAEHVDWLVGSRASSDALLHLKRRQRQLELIATLERRVGRCPTLPFTFKEDEVPRAAITALLDSVIGAER
ncbi:MAG: hypothetical protein HY899_14325 [Deltaproteobacteria bacterium]|nr:hypothetical protein [Deltaproteobacteria bacterium]